MLLELKVNRCKHQATSVRRLGCFILSKTIEQRFEEKDLRHQRMPQDRSGNLQEQGRVVPAEPINIRD